MAATLLLSTAGADLTFGAPVVDTVIMQDSKFDTDMDKAVARGEEGDKIGISFYGGQESEISGKYLTKNGAAIGAFGDTLSDVATAFNMTGDVVIYGIGGEMTHDGFQTGTYKACNLDGASL